MKKSLRETKRISLPKRIYSCQIQQPCRTFFRCGSDGPPDRSSILGLRLGATFLPPFEKLEFGDPATASKRAIEKSSRRRLNSCEMINLSQSRSSLFFGRQRHRRRLPNTQCSPRSSQLAATWFRGVGSQTSLITHCWRACP